jgi:DNA-binding NarL/FixJ family response regulator
MTLTMPISVVLADDQAMIRAGLRALLDAQDDLEVVAEASDGGQALAAARHHHPQVVVMDLRMPSVDGLEATRLIAADAHLGSVRVQVLTTFEEDELVFRALSAGASGFLLKDADPALLLLGIRTVVAGDALLAPSVTRRLVETFMSAPTPTGPNKQLIDLLTDRERQIVALVGHGMSNEEIAAHLALSPATARTHVSRAMTKLAARDRAQLVVFAYETGLVTPGRH